MRWSHLILSLLQVFDLCVAGLLDRGDGKRLGLPGFSRWGACRIRFRRFPVDRLPLHDLQWTLGSVERPSLLGWRPWLVGWRPSWQDDSLLVCFRRIPDHHRGNPHLLQVDRVCRPLQACIFREPWWITIRRQELSNQKECNMFLQQDGEGTSPCVCHFPLHTELN